MSNNEFDRIINQMSKSTTEIPKPKKNSKIASLLGILTAACLISFIGGALFMLINMILVSEFPNLAGIQPGIGFLGASRLFFLLFTLMCVLQSLNNVQKKS
mgnify:CR=1 FL=1